MSSRIRVLIADDQAISREGIRRILEREYDMEVVGAVQTAPEVLPQVRVKNPDVVLLDLRWHHDDQAMNEVIAQLRRGYPETSIIGLTAYEGLVEQAKAAGVLKSDRWYIEKDSRGSFVPVGLTAGNLKFDDYDSEAQVRIAYRKFYFTPKYIFIFMKLAWKHPALVKYGVFYMWRLVKLICFKKKSQHI